MRITRATRLTTAPLLAAALLTPAHPAAAAPGHAPAAATSPAITCSARSPPSAGMHEAPSVWTAPRGPVHGSALLWTK
ncbi:hypothetical protein CLM82_18160, partial [Streptomyces albidoflavus]